MAKRGLFWNLLKCCERSGFRVFLSTWQFDRSGGIPTNIIVCKGIVLLINQKDYEHFNEIWRETVRLLGFAGLVYSVNSAHPSSPF